MASLAPSFVMVNPSYIDPGVIMPYTQASGAFGALPGGAPSPRLSDGDLYVYMKRIDMRTRVAAGQAAYNELPSVSTTVSMMSTPTYLLRVRAEYDHHDQAAMGRWGVSLPEAQRLGMRAGHFQLARTALLYGMNPANGEGLLNAQGATATSLPADSNGHTTVVTYDNGEMSLFFLSVISAIKQRTFQLGIGRRFVIVGPQEVLGQLAYRNIVQLTQFQRTGAGSETSLGVIKDILARNGDQLDWEYDDTLIGKGAGGTDAILVVMPEVQQQSVSGINTNEFAKLMPGINTNTAMYCDMAAPREIPTPLPGGATDILSEWRISSGWGVRPEAITVVSMAYS